jgi:hypothetical protein
MSQHKQCANGRMGCGLGALKKLDEGAGVLEYLSGHAGRQRLIEMVLVVASELARIQLGCHFFFRFLGQPTAVAQTGA